MTTRVSVDSVGNQGAGHSLNSLRSLPMAVTWRSSPRRRISWPATRTVEFRTAVSSSIRAATNSSDIFVHDRATATTERAMGDGVAPPPGAPLLGDGTSLSEQPAGRQSRREIRRLRIARHQPGAGRHQRLLGHLRPRPPARHDLAGLRRQPRQSGRRAEREPGDLCRRAFRGLRVVRRQSRRRRRERCVGRLRPRPLDGRDRAGFDRQCRWPTRGSEPAPLDFGGWTIRRLPFPGRPRAGGRQRLRGYLRTRPDGRNDDARFARQRWPPGRRPERDPDDFGQRPGRRLQVVGRQSGRRRHQR